MTQSISCLRKAQKRAPSVRFLAALGTSVLFMVASSASAHAHCLRHIYNNTSRATWFFTILDQPSNNIVERYIKPGESSSYWIVTDGVDRGVYLTIRSMWLGEKTESAALEGSDCYFRHEGRSDYGVIWNEPADGDVTIVDYTPEGGDGPLWTMGN